MENKGVKVAFVQKIADDEFETETIWCDVKGENFIIDNIPIIAKNIALGDVVKAEFDIDENRYYFEDFVANSGNSTIRIFVYDATTIAPIRKWLNDNKCESEVLPARNIVAVNIPKDIVYTPIKAFLEDGEKNGKWTYEESCLEHEY
jgi:hypothetical protein